MASRFVVPVAIFDREASVWLSRNTACLLDLDRHLPTIQEHTGLSRWQVLYWQHLAWHARIPSLRCTTHLEAGVVDDREAEAEDKEALLATLVEEQQLRNGSGRPPGAKDELFIRENFVAIASEMHRKENPPRRHDRVVILDAFYGGLEATLREYVGRVCRESLPLARASGAGRPVVTAEMVGAAVEGARLDRKDHVSDGYYRCVTGLLDNLIDAEDAAASSELDGK